MGPGGAVTAVTGQSVCPCAHTMSRQPQWRHGSTQWSRVDTRPGRPVRWAARAGGGSGDQRGSSHCRGLHVCRACLGCHHGSCGGGPCISCQPRAGLPLGALGHRGSDRGDDELLVLLSDAGGDAVADLRASVAKVNDNPIRSEAGLVSATLSCGAVRWQARDTLLSAVARARTCHRAKARGVGTIEVEVP